MSETSKGFIANNWFKLFFVGLCLFLISLYFYRESQLDDCLQYTHLTYKNAWESQCKQEKKGSECSLPRYFADTLEKDRGNQVNECFRRYSFK